MDQGWIKLHRCLTNKVIWIESTPEQKTILITLLMMANHQEKEWEWQEEKYKAEPGQFVTSLETIVNKSGKGITIQNVRTALKRFEKYEFLTSKSTNRNRLVTIVNWGFYQGEVGSPNKQTNKQPTSNQQATNKLLTTNKNVRTKECKNDKNKDNIHLQIENLRKRYSIEQLKVIDDFLDTIRHTRSSGKIKETVIVGMYQDWDKHPDICVQYGLNTYNKSPALHSKKENYVLGIIRNSTADEAYQKLNNETKPNNKKVQFDLSD